MEVHPNPLIQRLRMFAKHRPERVDFELLELMRDAENAIITEQEMHTAWRKRATESEEARVRVESALREAREALAGMLELESHTHRLPGTVNAEWVAGIVGDAKAALEGEAK